MRFKARRDDNHKAMIETLRNLGISVADTAQLGSGFPDCVCAYGFMTCLVEIKDGEKSPSERKLTSDEEKFHKNWRGKIFIVESIDDCLKVRDWLMNIACRVRF